MVPFSDSLELRNSIILIKLARFVSSKEQYSIRKDLIDIIPKEVDIREDPWAKQKRIILKIPERTKIEDPESFLKEITQLPGVLSIILFKKHNFGFSTENLSETVKYTLEAIHSINKPIFIKFQAIGSIPFHKKAFRERIQKKRDLVNENDEGAFKIYFECKEEDSGVLGRLGYIYQDKKQDYIEEVKNKVSHSSISVILYSPYTSLEIADFCRIALNFDFLEVLFSNENEKIRDIIEETSKTSFKGINKVKYEIIPSLNNFIRNNADTYNFLGFSLHASKNVYDLKQAINNNSKIPCIVIGNEVRGLEYSTQKMIEMYKLGTGSSEPLRASHVLTFILGLIA